MPDLYRLHYAPYVDTNWAVTPGACTDMFALMGDQFGSLKAMNRDGGQGFALTGSDAQYGQVFPTVAGGGRFLVFRDGDIDEYDSGGTRTNRGTGYSGSYWDSASWGDQIIATQHVAATQSSTGAGFTDLSGAPYARYVEANVNFVMLARLNGGGSTDQDAVWWSGIRNPNTWTPSQATQSGNIRLLDVPGPITGLAAFRDEFIVFKADAVFRGRYIGPPYVFSWQVIAKGVGCSGRNTAECDGKLYFLDRNGVYAYDGNGISNVSQPVWAPSDLYPDESAQLQCTRDGVLWIAGSRSNLGSYELNAYSFNARTGLWARTGLVGTGSTYPTIVRGTANGMYNFKATWGVYPGFIWITNGASNKCTLAYPGVTDAVPTLQTGLIGGSHENAPASSRIYLRLLPATSTGAVTSGVMQAYRNEVETSSDSATLSWNETQQTLDGIRQANFKDILVTFATNKAIEVAGLGLEQKPGARR